MRSGSVKECLKGETQLIIKLPGIPETVEEEVPVVPTSPSKGHYNLKPTPQGWAQIINDGGAHVMLLFVVCTIFFFFFFSYVPISVW